ncbi:MAG: hypothetical protein ACJAZ3_000792 [Sphingobacteriales bacterium]|jgi:hypothetical protein
MESPKHLQHQPTISVNHYDKIDAQYRKNTDIKALSIGIAQYDDEEISLKVWRHSGNKWSRQSEELPLHRSIDLNILLLGALMTKTASGYPRTSLREEVDHEEMVEQIQEYYKSNKDFLEPRLKELLEKLKAFLNESYCW